WLGTSHVFRIDWNASSVTYFIDGTQVASHNLTIGGLMAMAASDYNVGGGAVTVDWVQLGPYASSGTFTSRIFDGGAALTWTTLSYTANTPAGTSVALAVRMGPTATPDSTWTDWVPLSGSGATIGASARYIQYEAILASNSSSVTPDLDSVTINGSLQPDTTPPSVVVRSPVAGAT